MRKVAHHVRKSCLGWTKASVCGSCSNDSSSSSLCRMDARMTASCAAKKKKGGWWSRIYPQTRAKNKARRCGERIHSKTLNCVRGRLNLPPNGRRERSRRVDVGKPLEDLSLRALDSPESPERSLQAGLARGPRNVQRNQRRLLLVVFL